MFNLINEIFVHILIQSVFQGEMVDRIEESIKSSQNYVEKAVADTAAAVVTSKKVRKVSKLFIWLFIYWCDDITSFTSVTDHFSLHRKNYGLYYVLLFCL